MSTAAAGESTGTGRLLRIAYWTLPPLLAVWFYWLGIKSWFLADDFAWLIHATEFSNFRELMHAIFMPMAQGTIRPWSERVFFMVFYQLFGLDPLPFHIWIFADAVRQYPAAAFRDPAASPARASRASRPPCSGSSTPRGRW